jgi:sulfatase modifying factor 1
MKRLSFLFLACLLTPSFLPAQSPVRAGKDYALFFVVTDFDYWPDLPGIDRPLRELATELETNYGFQKADFRLNSTKAQILDELSAYQKRTYGPQDQLLVFFSMHGQYDEAIGALIPRDGKLDDDTYESWITHPSLEAVMSKIPCAHLLLALDACYSGTFGSKYKGAPQRPAFEDRPTDCAGKIKEALEKTSRLYITSGGKERTPSKSEFAAKWLEALRQRNTTGLLSFAGLYAVLLEARPQPMYGDFRGHESGGDFVLAKRDLCVTKPTDPIEADKTDWRTAKQKNTIDAYFDYVTQHAQGLYVDEARDAMKRLTGSPAVSEQRPVIPAPKPADRSDNLVLIQGGTFQMGSNDGGADEKPVHSVTVSDFYLSKYELTVKEYLAFANETKSHYPEWLVAGSQYNIKTGTDDYYKKLDSALQNENNPIVGVSWEDAVAYCQWLSAKNGGEYRLPTEAEWEYAARGGKQGKKGSLYAGSSTVEEVAWYSNNSSSKTHPVGSKKADELGLCDMSGNVWEWCSDFYGTYSDGVVTNPSGPTKGNSHVFRGGGWSSNAKFCRTATRYAYSPWNSDTDVGFRLARSF